MTYPPGPPGDPASPYQGQPGVPYQPGQEPEVAYPDYAGYPPGAGYPGPQAPHNGYPVYGAYPAPPRDTNIWAILALISALTIAPLAIIAGHVALSQIKRTGEGGRGMAIAGLVLGYVFTVGLVVMTAFIVWVDTSMDNQMRDYNRDYSYSMSVTSGLDALHDQGPLPLASV